jgi:hypothetical protein
LSVWHDAELGRRERQRQRQRQRHRAESRKMRAALDRGVAKPGGSARPATDSLTSLHHVRAECDQSRLDVSRPPNGRERKSNPPALKRDSVPGRRVESFAAQSIWYEMVRPAAAGISPGVSGQGRTVWAGGRSEVCVHWLAMGWGQSRM